MPELEAFILVGGASSRMGRNKANLTVGGLSFVERASSALSAVAPHKITVVGNIAADCNGLPILCDEHETGRRGSIIGLHTALKNAASDWCVVLACDMPFANDELFTRLASLDRAHFDAIVPVQQDSGSQPLAAFYRRKTCLPAVEYALQTNDWSLRNLLTRISTRFVAFDEISDLRHSDLFFLNVNTPDEYTAAQAIVNSNLAEKFET
ncbi:MAG: molybdenum cofactor guanylyltransferase [Pyrinomonadaceae bacterium]